MILVNGYEKEYTLDLNEYPKNFHELNVVSYGDKGKLPWSIYFVSNKSVVADKTGDMLTIELDVKTFSNNTTIVIRNYKKELFKITIIPNTETIMEKKYDFFIDDKKITDGILSFKIISKRNDKDFPWKCTYFGAPLSYKIDKTEADGSAEVNVELLTQMSNTFSSKLIFTQEDSNNNIELSLLNDKEGIIKVD